jgi:NAD(P)-dependent dehydrogenase (short-subunit alcohol dehydrogenase family)
VTAALDLAAKAFGPVTVAVNCAGIAIASKTLGKSGATALNPDRTELRKTCISNGLTAR